VHGVRGGDDVDRTIIRVHDLLVASQSTRSEQLRCKQSLCCPGAVQLLFRSSPGPADLWGRAPQAIRPLSSFPRWARPFLGVASQPLPCKKVHIRYG
jgi:hypothetical protein